MLELWQAEWCPYSHRVRLRLTELELDWIARTFPTTDARSIGVPATVAPGYAAAAALVARLDGRPAIAVTTAPADSMTRNQSSR